MKTNRAVLVRLRAATANLVLVLASLAISYVVCELILFRLLLPTWPPAVRTYLPETADVLVQNSKAAAIPHDYIAVLGDSYSEGVGDWLLEAGNDRSKPFHSANIIHDVTRRDVVSFGREGIGSAEALVRMPTHILEGSKCFMFPGIEDPSRLVIYFYEGNDIHDNLTFLRKVSAQYGSTDRAAVETFLSVEYGRFPAWRCHLHLADTVIRMAKLYYYAHTRDAEGKLFKGVPTNVGLNQLLAGAGEVRVNQLHGPALDLPDDQIDEGARVFDQSLSWLRHRFPDLSVTVVYIPAPLSLYPLGGEYAYYMSEPVPGDPPWRRGRAPVARVARNSHMICGLIRDSSNRHDASFVDATPQLREAGARSPIHGPRDWSHLNEAGYGALGKLVADRLQNPAPAGCG